MTHFRLPLTLQFAPGESLRWTQCPSVQLKVLSGRLWLTHSGDPQDHFLHAGESCTLQRKTGTVIGAEGAVCVRIEAAGSPGWREMLCALPGALGWHNRPSGTPAPGGIIF